MEIEEFATAIKVKKSIVLQIFLGLLLAGCTKEIAFDYNEIEPVVVVEGRLTNEGAKVVITKSRSVNNSVKARCQSGAVVRIFAEGIAETLSFDAASDSYVSNLKGKPGTTYQLAIDFENHHYEGTSTMPAPASILTAQFLWQKVLDDRLLIFEVWAHDPDSIARNYYWCRMDRITHHPHFNGKDMTEAYRWSVFDDRGCPPGKVFRDEMCMSERSAEEDKEEDWERILYEGDTINYQMMTIDRSAYDFFTTLRAGQGGGANPRSNLTGGCQGYFVAGSVTYTNTIVFSYSKVR